MITFAGNVSIYDTMHPLNVFGSLSVWDTSTSLTGGRSPDPAPSSCTPGFPSFIGAFYSTAFQIAASTVLAVQQWQILGNQVKELILFVSPVYSPCSSQIRLSSMIEGLPRTPRARYFSKDSNLFMSAFVTVQGQIQVVGLTIFQNLKIQKWYGTTANWLHVCTELMSGQVTTK